MAEALGRLALDAEASPHRIDCLTEDDLGMIFGYLLLLVAWDETARGWVVCNRGGLTLAGPFRSRHAAREGRAEWVVEALRLEMDALRPH